MKTNAKVPAISQVKATVGLARYAFLASLRNRANLFFSLIFPLAFVAIFGLAGGGTQQIRIGVPDGFDTHNQIYTSIKAIADKPDSPVTFVTGSEADLEKEIGQSKVDGIVQSGDTLNVVTLSTSNANPAGGAAAQTLFNGVLSQMNLRAGGVTDPVFSIHSKELSGKAYKAIDFALPGQIGFSLISLATFGVAFSFISLRQTLVLKRLYATTVTPLSFVISQGLSRAVQAMVQTAIIIGVGVYAFDFNLAHGWVTFVEMLVLSGIGIWCFLGFGILISNLAKDEQTAPIMINLFNLPQYLLSGVFFSTDGFPKWLQWIGNILPLSFFNNGMRALSSEGQHLNGILGYIGGMVAWSVVAYYLAARTYRSE